MRYPQQSLRLRYGEESTCLAGSCVDALRKLPHRRAWVKSICAHLDESNVVKVTMPDGEFWANVKTGSLFDVNALRCRSGNLHIVRMM